MTIPRLNPTDRLTAITSESRANKLRWDQFATLLRHELLQPQTSQDALRLTIGNMLEFYAPHTDNLAEVESYLKYNGKTLQRQRDRMRKVRGTDPAPISQPLGLNKFITQTAQAIAQEPMAIAPFPAWQADIFCLREIVDPQAKKFDQEIKLRNTTNGKLNMMGYLDDCERLKAYAQDPTTPDPRVVPDWFYAPKANAPESCAIPPSPELQATQSPLQAIPPKSPPAPSPDPTPIPSPAGPSGHRRLLNIGAPPPDHPAFVWDGGDEG